MNNEDVDGMVINILLLINSVNQGDIVCVCSNHRSLGDRRRYILVKFVFFFFGLRPIESHFKNNYDFINNSGAAVTS